MNIKDYLQNHEIICIGIAHDGVLPDIIVNEPFDFIEKIEDMDYNIVQILWWERIEIGNAEQSIGHGGPRDPRDSRYYFSETDFEQNFDFGSPAKMIIEYVKEFQKKNSQYDLYPSFTIERV